MGSLMGQMGRENVGLMFPSSIIILYWKGPCLSRFDFIKVSYGAKSFVKNRNLTSVHFSSSVCERKGKRRALHAAQPNVTRYGAVVMCA